MAVNTLTAFLLLSIQKPQEALEFILIAERIVFKLIDMNAKAKRAQLSAAIDSNTQQSLEVIGESGIEDQLISHRINVGRHSPQARSGFKYDTTTTATKQNVFGTRNNSHQSTEESKLPSNKFTNKSMLNKNSASGFDIGVKKSCLSPTLLSNFVLAISLLKNVALHTANPDEFE